MIEVPLTYNVNLDIARVDAPERAREWCRTNCPDGTWEVSATYMMDDLPRFRIDCRLLVSFSDPRKATLFKLIFA